MFKRVFLFIATNLLVIAAISIILSVLGIGNYITEAGIDYRALMVFCLVWGMVGSFISLAISRWMAKKAMGVELIDPKAGGHYQWLVDTTYKICRDAKLPAMPEVGVYNSPDINAFATGPSKSKSLVAFSTGLLNFMGKDEIEGVIAHEVAHIKNGDMVTMTLIQGVINAFVMFLSRAIAFAISQNVKDDIKHIVHFVTIIVLQILFGFLGMIVVAGFSRKREFRADKGSAKLVGKDKMIAALEALKKVKGKFEADEKQEAVACLQISNNAKKKSFRSLFSTHPDLDVRIQALMR